MRYINTEALYKLKRCTVSTLVSLRQNFLYRNAYSSQCHQHFTSNFLANFPLPKYANTKLKVHKSCASHFHMKRPIVKMLMKLTPGWDGASFATFPAASMTHQKKQKKQ